MTRIAAVTAGASGIGLAIAERLHTDGFKVVVGDIDDAAGEALASRLPIRFEHLDASDEDSMRSFIAACGDVHVLVNNVGIRGATGDIWDISTDDFRSTFDANVWSHLLASQLVTPAMKRNGGGSIVMISSAAARSAVPGRAPYGVSKWALLGLTKALAHELAPWGIRANAVLPGNINNERFLGSMRLHAEHEGITMDEVLERFLARAPLKRLIEPAEIAAAVSYLASDGAAGTTGSFFDISGGQF